MTELRARGIQPDTIVCRSERPLSDALKRKISSLCDVPPEAVVNAADARNIYELPLVLHEEGLDGVVCKHLGLDGDVDLSEWEILVDRIEHLDRNVKIGLIGKYVSLPDAYLSVVESVKHGGFHHGASIEIEWIQAEDVEGLLAAGRLAELDGIVIPGGFGERGTEGKIAAAQFARENGVPCLGLCLGLQMMTVEFARNVCGLERANSTEMDPQTPHPVIDLMDSQRDVRDMGGTQRLGAYIAELAEGSQVAKAYGTTVVSERHRHRYEFNPRYRSKFETAGLWCSGMSPDGRLVEFIELPSHPFWVGTQAHPEFKSRPNRPAPLFREFVGAALARAEGRNPHLDLTIEADAPAPAAERLIFRKVGERVVHRGHVIDLVVGTFEGARRHDVRARGRAPSGGGVRRRRRRRRLRRPRPPVPGRGRRRPARAPRPASSTSTARTRWSAPSGSSPRRSVSPPTSGSCSSPSTTRRASPTSCTGSTWPGRSTRCPTTGRASRSRP